MSPRGLRAGVYVDVENIARNGGRGYAVRRPARVRLPRRRRRHPAQRLPRLRRGAGQPRPDYRNRATRYHFALRDVGFKVIEKAVQWYTNEDGVRVSKANSDLDLAVDMLLQSAKLDRVVLVSGDGDFVQVVRALQNLGCRVELIGFQNVSYDLRCESRPVRVRLPDSRPAAADAGQGRTGGHAGARPARGSAAPATITTPRRASASCATSVGLGDLTVTDTATRIRPTARRFSTARSARPTWTSASCPTAT